MRHYYRLHMKENYLNRDYCIRKAKYIIDRSQWKTITQEQLAKEMYGHAYVYYHWDFMKKLPVSNFLIYKHAADGIDIFDRTDKFQIVWEWIWNKKGNYDGK